MDLAELWPNTQEKGASEDVHLNTPKNNSIIYRIWGKWFYWCGRENTISLVCAKELVWQKKEGECNFIGSFFLLVCFTSKYGSVLYVLALKYENYTPVKMASNSYEIKKRLSSCNIPLGVRS